MNHFWNDQKTPHRPGVLIIVLLQLHIPLRLLCGGLLFTCNAVMWTFLAKALRYSSSSTWTTVTTTASNFISSVSPTCLLWCFPQCSRPDSISPIFCRHSLGSWSLGKPRLHCGGLASPWPSLACWYCSGSPRRMRSKTPSPRKNNQPCLHPLTPAEFPLIHTFRQRKVFW